MVSGSEWPAAGPGCRAGASFFFFRLITPHSLQPTPAGPDTAGNPTDLPPRPAPPARSAAAPKSPPPHTSPAEAPDAAPASSPPRPAPPPRTRSAPHRSHPPDSPEAPFGFSQSPSRFTSAASPVIRLTDSIQGRFAFAGERG